MASSGPSARPCVTASRIGRPSSPSFSAPETMLPRPLLGSRPCSSSSSPCSSKSAGKKACTAWPKMIGSETFIMVAFRCSENSTPSSLARWICALRNSCRSEVDIFVASTTSPALTGTESLSTSVRSSVTSSMRRVPSSSTTTDFSLWRKSCSSIVATLVRLSEDQAPIEWGCLRA